MSEKARNKKNST